MFILWGFVFGAIWQGDWRAASIATMFLLLVTLNENASLRQRKED